MMDVKIHIATPKQESLLPVDAGILVKYKQTELLIRIYRSSPVLPVEKQTVNIWSCQ